jgi:uracil-DNA glycosylase
MLFGVSRFWVSPRARAEYPHSRPPVGVPVSAEHIQKEAWESVRVSLTRLLREIRDCWVCAAHLPLGPRPVLSVAKPARLLVISQAPGSKVHQSGVPWSDASGDRLRDWMGIDASIFYDKTKVAIVPMGFCYPGASGSGGDNPPRPECATLWHERLIKHLPRVELTLLVGQYAHRRYLGSKRKNISDGNRQSICGIRSRFPAVAAPQLAQRDLGKTEPVV